jgi:hypothetical protein
MRCQLQSIVGESPVPAIPQSRAPGRPRARHVRRRRRLRIRSSGHQRPPCGSPRARGRRQRVRLQRSRRRPRRPCSRHPGTRRTRGKMRSRHPSRHKERRRAFQRRRSHGQHTGPQRPRKACKRPRPAPGEAVRHPSPMTIVQGSRLVQQLAQSPDPEPLRGPHTRARQHRLQHPVSTMNPFRSCCTCCRNGPHLL